MNYIFLKRKKGERMVDVKFHLCLFQKGFSGTFETKSIDTWRHKFLVYSQKK